MRNRKNDVKSAWNFKTGTLIAVPVVLLLVAGGVWFVRSGNSVQSELRTPAAVPQKPFESAQVKPKFESPIFQTLQKRDWTKLAELLNTTDPSDAKLTQLIYFLDTKTLEPDNVKHFFKAVLTWVDSVKFSKAREVQLLSHILGKLNLNSTEKKQVEKLFAKNGWSKKRPWTQVSISWVPMPDSTFQDLKTLLKPGRSDMTADFVHFLSKVKDEKAKRKLLVLAHASAQGFEPEQKRYLVENLKNLTALANSDLRREH